MLPFAVDHFNSASWVAEKNIDAALEARNQKVDDQERGEYVVVKDEIFEGMRKTPFLSSNHYYSH